MKAITDGVLRGAGDVVVFTLANLISKLAGDLQADELIILTSVPCVYRHFGTPEQEAISAMTVAQAKELMALNQCDFFHPLPVREVESEKAD